MREFKHVRILFSIALPAVLAGALAAQSTTPPAIQSLTFERALNANQVLTTLTPNLPPVVAAGLLAGALELRESIAFNPINQVLSFSAFVVQAGAPLPTPANASLSSSTFSIASMIVDKVYSSTTPRNSLMLTGTMGTNSPISPYGNLSGAPTTLSLGYTND